MAKEKREKLNQIFECRRREDMERQPDENDLGNATWRTAKRPKNADKRLPG